MNEYLHVRAIFAPSGLIKTAFNSSKQFIHSAVSREVCPLTYIQVKHTNYSPFVLRYNRVYILINENFVFFQVYTLWFKLLRAPETITEEDIAGYHKTINLIQSELKQRGTKFLDGDQPGFVDYMIWPWFERLLIFNSDASRLDEKNFKVAVRIYTNLYIIKLKSLLG